MREYGNKIVSPNHRVSRYVQRVAEQILSSAGLGHVKGYNSYTASSESSPFASMFGSEHFDPDSRTASRSNASTANEEWEVFVISDDSTRNAFVLPGAYLVTAFDCAWKLSRFSGGKIFVFTGILPVAKTEDGLASVLGHGMLPQLLHRLSVTNILMSCRDRPHRYTASC